MGKGDKFTENVNNSIDLIKQPKPSRCCYIDWLRVFTMIMLFFFHNAHLFDVIDWHIKNSQRSFWATAFVVFVHLWSMPLLFLLAGSSTWYALHYKGGTEYIEERFRRLVIPFTFGILIVVPPQIYVESLSKSLIKGSIFYNYPHLFANNPVTIDPQFFSNCGHHLWFLPFLFIFSCLDIPLSLFLRRERGLRLISRSAIFLERGYNLLWSVIPVTLIQISLRIKYPAYCSWADFWFWFVFFIYGYLIKADQRLPKAILKLGSFALATGIGCIVIIGYLYGAGFLTDQFIQPKFSPGYIFFMFVYVLAAWSWVVVFLNLGMRFLNFKNWLLSYAQEAVLPFYILHPTVILLIGFYGVRWNLPIIAKFALISGGSFVVAITVYEFLIRRFNFIRICFGLRSLK